MLLPVGGSTKIAVQRDEGAVKIKVGPIFSALDGCLWLARYSGRIDLKKNSQRSPVDRRPSWATAGLHLAFTREQQKK
jgi:hypothetical protein